MKAAKVFGAFMVAFALYGMQAVMAPQEPVSCPQPIVRKTVQVTPEMQVVRMVNCERSRRGLPPLSVSPKLMAVSEGWSATQANRHRMYHSRNGYGENVAVGQRSPSEVQHAWMNSRGHRNNILNTRYTQIGVGLAYDRQGRPYWTQSFM
jgi:uncharacterized protein YkwD